MARVEHHPFDTAGRIGFISETKQSSRIFSGLSAAITEYESRRRNPAELSAQFFWSMDSL